METVEKPGSADKQLLVQYNLACDELRSINSPTTDNKAKFACKTDICRNGVLHKVLVANRGEIAKRFFLALHEECIPSVAVVTDADRSQSWYEFADEVVFIGDPANYTNIPIILAAANISNSNAVYGGYGFLSENAGFVRSIEVISRSTGQDLIFMGPDYETMLLMGDKVRSRELARKYDVPLFESSQAFTSPDYPKARAEADRIGYPVIVKLSSGGGGKGMYPVFDESELESALESSYRIGKELYNDSTFYMEKFIERPVHIEVQVFNGDAIGIRKCAVQRRNQKIIEETGDYFLEDYMALSLLAEAEKIAKASGYRNGCGAGTVEFLIDDKTGTAGFMEMNTRLQVEYAVTDQSLGIDLLKWQILQFDGRVSEISAPDLMKYKIQEKNHAIECRIYAEEPENDYLPSPGTIMEMDLPTFNGIRCDFGFTKGDRILPMYDPMIGKLIAQGSTRQEAIIRLERALQELYIMGVKTNIKQLLNIVRHHEFIKGDYTNNILKDFPELSRTGSPEPDTISKMPYIQHVLFGAFAEYVKLLQDAINRFTVIVKRESIVESPVLGSEPYRFKVSHEEKNYTVEFIHIRLSECYAMVNGVFMGSIYLSMYNDRTDDIKIIYENRSMRIRVDRYAGQIVLRLKGKNNKIDYYRMKIIPEGDDTLEAKGVVSSPFQGTFVSFTKENISTGDYVKEGESLVVLSAMKMETTLTAPISGTISYIIDDGDLSRLIISKTPDGRIIGRSIQEGELLIRIEPHESEQVVSEEKTAEHEFQVPLQPSMDEPLDVLYGDSYLDQILSTPARYVDRLLELFRAAVLGMMQNSQILERLLTIMEKIPIDAWQELTNENRADIINDIILHYTSIRRLFSPVTTDDGFSFPEEFDRYVRNWENREIKFDRRFMQEMNGFMTSYGINELKSVMAIQKTRSNFFFLLLKQSYEFCIVHWKKIGIQFHILVNLPLAKNKTLLTLKRLLEHTQAESDDSSYKKIREIAARVFKGDVKQYLFSNGDMVETGSDVQSGIVKEYEPEPLEQLSEISDTLIPVDLPESFVNFLSGRILSLSSIYELDRFESGMDSTLLFRLKKEDEGHRYLCMGYVSSTTKEDVYSACIESFGKSLSLFQICRKPEEYCTNSLELFLDGVKVSLNEFNVGDFLSYDNLLHIVTSLRPYFDNGTLARCIIHADMLTGFGTEGGRKSLVASVKDDAVRLDLPTPTNNEEVLLLSNELSQGDDKMYQLDKWPIERWIEECLDAGSTEEFIIPSIDKAAEKPVGSRIYLGAISGLPVCFYMKDYRVRGGATGDLEGRKYAAAVYLSFIKGLPLYVWNDSAGANIKEGVVSLNRGGEGFMMNSLISESVNFDTFYRYIDNVPNPELNNLFQEVDTIIGNKRERSSERSRAVLVAVGTGASAGLDVYGSSQATIQLLLDSENSYRVLTGSNVIKSVMGEDISNYDIGGAKVLGKWAGVVDQVARDKLHLISMIFRIQYLFYCHKSYDIIQRRPITPTKFTHSDTIVLNEALLENNVDEGMFWPFRDQYYGANVLVAGFAKLAGNRVFIMGPRTQTGIKTSAAAIKARELLRLALRTGTHQILIFGKNWQQLRSNYENMSLRSRFDMLNTFKNTINIRIHIILDPEGMKCLEINSFADVIIYVKSTEENIVDRNFTEKNATFQVDSLPEAMDLSASIIDLTENRQRDIVAEHQSIPEIPLNSSEPYDMIDSVITKLFDQNSFIEFFRYMNNAKTGPNLITGMARINGETVGIIADQPQIKGGGADAAGTEKFRIFTEFINKHGIPLVMLSNSSGFVPGSKEERFRIQSIGADSLNANILGTVPVVSVTLNQNFGGRLIQAFNRFLRPGIIYVALRHAVMAVVGFNAAFDLLAGKKYRELQEAGDQHKADEFYNAFRKEFTERSLAENDAYATGLVDHLVDDIRDLRNVIIKALAESRIICEEVFS